MGAEAVIRCGFNRWMGSVRFFVFRQLELIINLPIFPVNQVRGSDMHP